MSCEIITPFSQKSGRETPVLSGACESTYDMPLMPPHAAPLSPQTCTLTNSTATYGVHITGEWEVTSKHTCDIASSPRLHNVTHPIKHNNAHDLLLAFLRLGATPNTARIFQTQIRKKSRNIPKTLPKHMLDLLADLQGISRIVPLHKAWTVQNPF